MQSKLDIRTPGVKQLSLREPQTLQHKGHRKRHQPNLTILYVQAIELQQFLLRATFFHLVVGKKEIDLGFAIQLAVLFFSLALIIFPSTDGGRSQVRRIRFGAMMIRGKRKVSIDLIRAQ